MWSYASNKMGHIYVILSVRSQVEKYNVIYQVPEYPIIKS